MLLKTKEEVNRLWEDETTKGTPLYLYIDNPFCVSKCKFCVYNPQVKKIGGKEYNKYYDMLKREIENSYLYLQAPNLKGVYFGGGTASALTTPLMREIFNLIPNLKSLESKSFECNPVITSDAKIDILKEYGFNYVSFGIQSMDSEVLKGQNRIPYNIPKLNRQIRNLKDSGINVNVDLLAYMESGDNSDLDTLKTDISRVFKELNPSWITIYPMYQRFNKRRYVELTDAEIQKDINLATKLRMVISNFLEYNPEYTVSGMSMDNLEDQCCANMTIMRKEEEVNYNTDRYNSSGPRYRTSSENTLAIGGYNKHEVYSYAGATTYFTTYNPQTGIIEHKIKE